MLKIKEPASAPFWLTYLEATDDQPTIRFQFRPIDGPMIVCARRAAWKVMAQGDVSQDAIDMAMTLSIASQGICGWEGIGDADGNVVTPTHALINDLLRDTDNLKVLDWVRDEYVGPKFEEISEKNASSLSRNGTSGAAQTSASTALTPADDSATPAQV